MRRAHMCGILVRSSKTSYHPSSQCKSNRSYIHPQNAPWSADKLFPARILCFCGCSASIALEQYIIPLRTDLQGGGEDGATRPTINERGLWCTTPCLLLKRHVELQRQTQCRVRVQQSR